ncbi:heavy metal-associated isoprenylated plant protein 6-like [Vitis riparia]|uniref:heavy metal-associated isoprenylated plant protein 6-like n=1 Tax=Vitis riparia TaxID=96939 RepID=UPI00155ADF1B|nr:heavy metal-associated isoprenylated plant protein 6-like [Vitis riparia]
MAEVMTIRLRVDLECDCCYKKIKKLLRKFPEIRDQAFFKEENTVVIKIVCCNPHEIRDKLIRKSRKTIKGIEMIVPEKPKPPPEKPKPPPEKPKEPEKPKP